MSSDPTEYNRIPPTQQAGTSPYAYYDVPPIPPPPPPKQRRPWLLVVSIIGGISLLVVFVLGGLLIASRQEQSALSAMPTLAPTMPVIPTPTPMPTQAPTIIVETPTPVPMQQAPYSAESILADFIQAGIPIDGSADGYGLHLDSKWSCCTYAPEGGAYWWIDSQSESNVDVATFASPIEVVTDSNQLRAQGFNTAWTGTCLLSFNMNFPQDEAYRYYQVMQQVCY